MHARRRDTPHHTHTSESRLGGGGTDQEEKEREKKKLSPCVCTHTHTHTHTYHSKFQYSTVRRTRLEQNIAGLYLWREELPVIRPIHPANRRRAAYTRETTVRRVSMYNHIRRVCSSSSPPRLLLRQFLPYVDMYTTSHDERARIDGGGGGGQPCVHTAMYVCS